MAEEIVNKVAKSGLINIKLTHLKPEGLRKSVDIAPQLWNGIALREKEFRIWVKEHDWQAYTEAYVCVNCSVDAIIPAWAFMLIASQLSNIAREVFYGSSAEMESMLFKRAIHTMDVAEYEGARVLVNGCGEGVPQSAYLDLTLRLQPHVKSLMFGEACSSVPVYKAPKI